MSDLTELRDKVAAMKDAKIADAKSRPLGSELRLMAACQADGMVSAIGLIDALIAKESDDAEHQ